MKAMLLVLAVVLWLALLTGVIWLRRRDQRRLDADRRVVRLHFPMAVSADAVLAFTRAVVVLRSRRRTITSGIPAIVFEVVSTPGRLEHRLHLPRYRCDELIAQLRVAIPGIDIEFTEAPAMFTETPAKAVTELQLSAADRALRTDLPDSTAAALLAAMAQLQHGERIVVQYAVTPQRSPQAPPSTASRKPPADGWVGLVSTILDRQSMSAASPKDWADKHAEPIMAVALRIAAEAATPARAGALVRAQVAVLHSVERPGIGFVKRRLSNRVVADRLRRAAAPDFGTRFLLNARELAALIAWPSGAPRVPGLTTGRARRLAPVPEVPQTGLVLGDSLSAGDPRPIAISAADSLLHIATTGPTGSGKSTFLGNLAIQHVEAGRALVLVDPKRDLAEAVADRIPSDRIGDVIWLDLSDSARPVGLNVLEGSEHAPERISDQVLGIFTRRYGSQLGPRSRDVLHAGLLTLARLPGMTLAELPVLLSDSGFRERVLGQGTTDRVLAQFWAGFEAVSPAERSGIVAPLMNKLRTYLLDPRIRVCIGQAPSTWTMEQVLNDRRILLVVLDRGQLGSETASVIGSLVTTLVWESAQRRTIRLPAALILDEFQDFVSSDTDLGDVLAKARSFGIGACLAHQHEGQLDPKLRAAVAANARTKVAFQAGIDDATVLARQLGGGLTPADVMGLGAYQAYVAACVGGQVKPPASLATRPLPPSRGTLQLVRAASRERFGRDRAEVEAATAARQDGGVSESGLGRRRRSS